MVEKAARGALPALKKAKSILTNAGVLPDSLKTEFYALTNLDTEEKVDDILDVARDKKYGTAVFGRAVVLLAKGNVSTPCSR